MIERILLDNYCGFDAFEWQPAAVNLLTGSNGSGKSLLLDALFGLAGVVSYRADPGLLFQPHTISRGSRGRKGRKQRIELDLGTSDGSYRYALEVEREDRDVVSVDERLSLGDSVLMELQAGILSKKGRQTHYFTGISGVREQKEPEIVGFCEALERIVFTSKSSFFPRIAGALRLSPSLDNFPAWFNETCKDREALGTTLESCFDVELETLLESGPIDPAFFIRLSSGEKALWVQRLIACLLSPSSVLCLDDPEHHMAFKEIRPWLEGCLQRIDRTGSQLIVTSHHPTVIDTLGATVHQWWLGRLVRSKTRSIHLQARTSGS